MFDNLRIEQHLAEQFTQHSAIIGSLTSAELLLRAQVCALNQSEIRQAFLIQNDKLPPLQLAKEMIKKNDLLLEQIYAKIDRIRVSAHNLFTINRFIIK